MNTLPNVQTFLLPIGVFTLFLITVIFAVFSLPNIKLNQKYNRCIGIADHQNKNNCFIDYLKDYGYVFSVKQSIELASKLQSQGIITDCHSLVHPIGQENFNMNNHSLASAFASCSPLCQGACYHGVMIGAVGTEDEALANIEELILECQLIENFELKQQCFHGLGHGIASLHKLGFNESVKVCNMIKNKHHNYACLGGVFMQNADNLLSVAPSNLEKYMTSVCDPNDIGNDTSIRELCSLSVGGVVATFTNRDVLLAEKVCNAIDKAKVYQKMCYAGVVSRLNSSNHL